MSARTLTLIFSVTVLMTRRSRIILSEMIAARIRRATGNALELRKEDAHRHENDELQPDHAMTFFNPSTRSRHSNRMKAPL